MIGIAGELNVSSTQASRNQPLWSISWARLRVVALAAAYYVAFAWMYIAYVSEAYASFGFGFQADWPLYDVSIVTILCLAPSWWIPVRFERPSAVFIYFQYFLIYVPAIWMTRHSVLPVLSQPDQVLVSTTLAIAMFAMLWAHYRLPLLRLGSNRLSAKQFWWSVYIFAGILVAALIAQLGGNFHLVSFADIYAVRQDAADLVAASGNVFVNYAFTWLNGVILPMIFARAISRSQWVELLAVVGCYVFLFGIWGAKTSLFSPVILFTAYVWASRGSSRMPVLMVLAFITLMLIPALLPFEEGVGALIKLWWIAIVDMRTFSVPGLSISQYFDFFSVHPLTFGSHVTGVNWFITYPYDLDIPRTVGYYYYAQELTANASFWAQDGLAGFGVSGLIIVTLIAAVILWLLDSVTQGLHIRFVATALIGTIVAFTNTSVFTTLMTGGLGLFLLASLYLPRESWLRADRPSHGR